MKKTLVFLTMLLAAPAFADVTIKGPITFRPNFAASGAKVSLDNLSITKTGATGPSVCGNTLGLDTFNCVWINGDSVVPSNIGKLNTLFFYTVDGGTGSGNPVPVGGAEDVVAVPSSISISTFYGGGLVLGQTEVPSGGSIGSNFFSDAKGLGNIYGNGVYAVLRPGATGWHTMAGEEIDIKTGAGSSVEARIGVNIVAGPDSAAVQGSLVDAALLIDVGGAGSSTPLGWKNAIQIGYFNEVNNAPITVGGRVLTVFTGSAKALDTGIDISGTWNSGAGYTYTGDFFKGDGNNHWQGDGAIIATTTGAASHDFVTTTASQNVASFENVGGNASIIVNNRTATQQAVVTFTDTGTAKWQMGKHTDNTFFLTDTAQSKNALTVGAAVAGQVVLGETGGSQLTLVPSGGSFLTGLATTGDGTGLFVCQNASDGKLYRKSTCP